MPPDLERLAAYARERGSKRNVAAVIFLIGCLPAFLVVMLRPSVGVGPVLVGPLLIFTPVALLFIWTVRDTDGQAAREVVMWLRVVDRAVGSAPWAIPYKELRDVPPDEELSRVRLDDFAIDLREAIGPVVAGGGLNMRIAIQRFWYPVQGLALSLVLAALVVLVLPSLATPG